MLTPDTPQTWQAADRLLAALEPYEPREQLTATGWGTIAVLGALRPRFEGTSEDRQTFDDLCSETLTWLRREIEQLRFTKTQ